MSNTKMLKKIARLESINDHLRTEVDYIDELMKLVGFQHGLATVKAAAGEILRQKISGVQDI